MRNQLNNIRKYKMKGYSHLQSKEEFPCPGPDIRKMKCKTSMEEGGTGAELSAINKTLANDEHLLTQQKTPKYELSAQVPAGCSNMIPLSSIGRGSQISADLTRFLSVNLPISQVQKLLIQKNLLSGAENAMSKEQVNSFLDKFGGISNIQNNKTMFQIVLRYVHQQQEGQLHQFNRLHQELLRYDGCTAAQIGQLKQQVAEQINEGNTTNRALHFLQQNKSFKDFDQYFRANLSMTTFFQVIELFLQFLDQVDTRAHNSANPAKSVDIYPSLKQNIKQLFSGSHCAQSNPGLYKKMKRLQKHIQLQTRGQLHALDRINESVQQLQQALHSDLCSAPGISTLEEGQLFQVLAHLQYLNAEIKRFFSYAFKTPSCKLLIDRFNRICTNLNQQIMASIMPAP